MRYDPDKHHRRTIRLRGWDYTQTGAYFITLCVQNRECLFGDVINGEMWLNDFGEIVLDEWHRTADVRCEITLDAFVVMPNHVHGIIVINNADGALNHGHCITVGAARRVAPIATNRLVPRSIGAIIGQFKSISTKRINAQCGVYGISTWQRDYYEHIISNGGELNRIRKYIMDNPRHWKSDRENLGFHS